MNTRATRSFSRGSVSIRRRGLSTRRSLTCHALFTGIVQGRARVLSSERSGETVRLIVCFPPGLCDDVAIGASVSLNGTCLTATSKKRAEGAENTGMCIAFDIVDETLRRTNLGIAQPGSELNFERSARLGDEIGGHNVSGHVCCTAHVASIIRQDDGNVQMKFVLDDPSWGKYILPKGYVAVNGCSLTVGEAENDCDVAGGNPSASFTVYLIPETLRVTVFGTLKVKDLVNIEVESQTQTIVDTVERVLSNRAIKV